MFLTFSLSGQTLSNTRTAASCTPTVSSRAMGFISILLQAQLMSEVKLLSARPSTTWCVEHGSVTLQQRSYRTATLPLQRNCYFLCVGINLRVVVNFHYCLIFFYAKTLFWVQFFDLQLLLNCYFETVAVILRCCNVGKL